MKRLTAFLVVLLISSEILLCGPFLP